MLTGTRNSRDDESDTLLRPGKDDDHHQWKLVKEQRALLAMCSSTLTGTDVEISCSQCSQKPLQSTRSAYLLSHMGAKFYQESKGFFSLCDPS